MRCNVAIKLSEKFILDNGRTILGMDIFMHTAATFCLLKANIRDEYTAEGVLKRLGKGNMFFIGGGRAV